jgi:hypothetical protein
MSDLARSSLRWQAPRCSRGRWILGALVGGLLGCAGPPPRTANPTRPLDERRAVEIIIRAFHEERDRPVPGRKVELTADKRLEVDVGAQGKKYGVAYVSLNERVTLGSALPPRDPAMGDALQLVRGLGAEADARILVLHDSEYQYDDQLGTERTVTSITAERKLERDVRDFLVRAHAERWP